MRYARFMPMKLSEAIRLGAMIRPQGFGALFDGDNSCALGAAAEAAGLIKLYRGDLRTSTTYVSKKTLAETFPLLKGWLGRIIFTWIVIRNDQSQWTRERIALRLERWERRMSGVPSGTTQLEPIATAPQPALQSPVR